MKKIKNIILTAVIALSSLSFTFAQSKVAHLNVSEVMMLMPETKSAESDLQKLAQTYQSEIKDLEEAYAAKVKQYDAEAVNQTDETNQSRLQEVQEMQQSMQQYNQQAQKDLQKQQIDRIVPIQEKILAAINAVADSQGIEYVFDSTPGQGQTGLVFKGKDLAEDVRKELGL